jgi:hypothetical protein
MSQKEAAILGVKSVGLNQIQDIQRDWFYDDAEWNMFSRRMDILKQQ